jgi:haloacetate dehalogenase
VFDGFTLEHVDVGEAILRVRHGGAGPAIVLLHGHPRTHTTWHRVAPLLATRLTVVCPDLRGYGLSSKPASTPDHAPYSKRAMAEDIHRLMAQLGHDRYAVVGHDRGAYVASRLARDRPEAVTHLAILEAIPILDALERTDARFAEAWWHWFFFAQPEKPERAILADPNAWYSNTPEALGEGEPWDDYQRAIHDPDTVHAMLEDYRAGLGIDRRHDEEDRAADRRIACPLLLLWATRDDLVELHGDVVAIWRNWADDVRGAPIESGHHLAEDAPEVLARELVRFVGA